jgi:hypothetical protein
MFVLRRYTVSLLAGMLLAGMPLAGILPTPAFAGQGSAKSERPPAQVRQNAPPKANNHPGEQILRGLSQMTPEELEKALSRLPPAQRANIEKQIQNFQKLPPAAQKRRLDRLELLNNLPPQRQQEVRRSMNQLKDLPEDRRKAINRELQRMSVMPDDERQSHMNTDAFRNRFSPDERRMLGNLAEIQPFEEN